MILLADKPANKTKFMKYVFKGNLAGLLCEDCVEPLSGIEELIYQPWQTDRVLERAVASPKETFREVRANEAASSESLLIARTKTDRLQLNNPPNDMIKCTYALKLYWQRRLHNGDDAWGTETPLEQLFFYNV